MNVRFATHVEALAAGCEAVGVDISTLAEFVAGVKSTVVSGVELAKLAVDRSRRRVGRY
jgi:hypothetical protein